MSSKHKFCYVFYFCLGLVVLALHALGIASDAESLAMYIVLGWPVSVPVIVGGIILPAVVAARTTFGPAPRDWLLIGWFFINLAFWFLFINNFVFIIEPLVFQTPLIIALSYLYACLSMLLPAIRIVFRSHASRLSATLLILAAAVIGLCFYDFQQGEFSSKKSLSVESIRLLDAIDKGDLSNVEWLLQTGADLNARDEYGWDALMHGVYWQHTEIVEYLLEQGADPNTRENKSGVRNFGAEGKTGQVISGRTAVQYAMRQRPPWILGLLLQYGAQPKTIIKGLSATDIAVGRGELGELARILQGGRDVRTDQLAVELAAMNENEELLYLLLEAGAEPTAGLFVAVRQSRIQNVKILLDSGADLDALDHTWWTPLAFAKSVEIARMLILSGADINYINPGGYPSKNSILTRMAGKRVPEVVRLLIDAGADIDHQNYHGMTALMSARDPLTIELLIEAGADIKKTDKEGRTALDYAESRGMVKVIPLLTFP